MKKPECDGIKRFLNDCTDISKVFNKLVKVHNTSDRENHEEIVIDQNLYISLSSAPVEESNFNPSELNLPFNWEEIHDVVSFLELSFRDPQSPQAAKIIEKIPIFFL